MDTTTFNNELKLNELFEENKRLKLENENNENICNKLRKKLDEINMNKRDLDEYDLFEHLDDDEFPDVPDRHNGDYLHRVELRLYVPCDSKERQELENVWSEERSMKSKQYDMTANEYLDKLQDLFDRKQSVQYTIASKVSALLEKWIEDASDNYLHQHSNICISPSAGSYEIFDVEFNLATHDDDSIAEADWYAKEVVMNMLHKFPETEEMHKIKVLRKLLDTEPDELYD